ncbi:MAG TPA: trigger factor [Candidatus Dormibacteraeota bacterium]|nr:trigger factor [Candidatus Dormibacteraeota bacterium]
MNASTLTRLEPTRVELEIPLTADEVDAARQRAFSRLSRKVKLPGFRPGKIPRRLFEQTYGTDAIESEALDDVAPVAYARAMREHDLDPVDRPTIELLPEEEGKPTRLKATVEVRPRIELGEYKGVAVEVPLVVVTEADVEAAVQAFARERATLVPVERPARLGDVVTIDYEGRIEGDVFEGGTAERQEAELVEERFIPGFAHGISGMSNGETKTFEVSFPADYAKTEYAGKAASFTVTLHEVKEIDVPALDDEFAKSVSESQSLEDLRVEIRKRLEAVAEGRRRRAIGNAVMEHLLGRLEIPVPQGLVEREVESMIAETAQRARRAGIGFDEYLARIGATEETLRAKYREDAATQVKGTLVLEAVAKAEGIEASPAEVREEIEVLAQRYDQSPQRMREALASSMSSLKEGIVRSKTLDLLVDHAKVGAPPGDSSDAKVKIG